MLSQESSSSFKFSGNFPLRNHTLHVMPEEVPFCILLGLSSVCYCHQICFLQRNQFVLVFLKKSANSGHWVLQGCRVLTLWHCACANQVRRSNAPLALPTVPHRPHDASSPFPSPNTPIGSDNLAWPNPLRDPQHNSWTLQIQPSLSARRRRSQMHPTTLCQKESTFCIPALQVFHMPLSA